MALCCLRKATACQYLGLICVPLFNFTLIYATSVQFQGGTSLILDMQLELPYTSGLVWATPNVGYQIKHGVIASTFSVLSRFAVFE